MEDFDHAKKCFNPTAFCVPVPSQEFLTSVCIVSSSFSVYVNVAGVYGDYFFRCTCVLYCFWANYSLSCGFFVIHWIYQCVALSWHFSSRWVCCLLNILTISIPVIYYCIDILHFGVFGPSGSKYLMPRVHVWNFPSIYELYTKI